MAAAGSLPSTCQSLGTLHDLPDQTMVDVMGLVVDTLPPAKTVGRNYQATICILDHACSSDVGVKVKFFFANLDQFQMPDQGDVVIISRIRKTSYQQQTVLLFRDHTRMTIFSVAKIPDQVIADSGNGCSSIPRSSIRLYPKQSRRTITQPEERYAVALWQWALNSSLSVADKIRNRSQYKPPIHQVPVATAPGRKPTLLREVKHDNYYTLVGEVVKIYTRDMAQGRLSLYITDYTMNSQFYYFLSKPEDYSARQWETLPEGKFTLQVTMWEPHAEYACEHVTLGSFVQLRNVRVLYKDETKSLEGRLHGDKIPDKIHVQVLEESHPICKEILARRDELASRTNKTQMGQDTETGKSKKRREKRKRQQKGKELQEKSLAKGAEALPDPFLYAQRMDENLHIVAGFNDRPPQPLHSIINSPQLHGKMPEGGHVTYPFMLAKFRAHVRVVDFYPPRLEDFSRSLNDPEFNDQRAHEDWRSPPPEWEWAFFLLVEDGNAQNDQHRERVKVLVAGPEAEYLLKLTASDLRRDVVNLKALREKLFFLWGELEKDKTSGDLMSGKPTKNKPFTCCIQEYGVRGEEDDWIRMHKMFSTTIKD